MSLTAAKADYAAGRITITEFEAFLDAYLPNEGKPPPRCQPGDHEWIDITTFGEAYERGLCARCGLDRTVALVVQSIAEAAA